MAELSVKQVLFVRHTELVFENRNKSSFIFLICLAFKELVFKKETSDLKYFLCTHLSKN